MVFFSFQPSFPHPFASYSPPSESWVHFRAHIEPSVLIEAYIFFWIDIHAAFRHDVLYDLLEELNVSLYIWFHFLNNLPFLLFPKCLLDVFHMDLHAIKFLIGYFLLNHGTITNMIMYLFLPSLS